MCLETVQCPLQGQTCHSYVGTHTDTDAHSHTCSEKHTQTQVPTVTHVHTNAHTQIRHQMHRCTQTQKEDRHKRVHRHTKAYTDTHIQRHTQRLSCLLSPCSRKYPSTRGPGERLPFSVEDVPISSSLGHLALDLAIQTGFCSQALRQCQYHQHRERNMASPASSLLTPWPWPKATCKQDSFPLSLTCKNHWRCWGREEVVWFCGNFSRQ